jgi:hypothetical protein
MTSRPLLLAAFSAFFVLGCAVQTSFTLTRTGPTMPPRPENCEFEMLTAAPTGSYAELGTLDLTSGAPTNLGEFRSAIRPQVCRAGGDAALAIANTFGIYLKATVLKRVDGPPPAGGAPIAGGGMPSSQPPAAPSGCSFDTQCKGDRVCAQGACVDPPGGGSTKK